MEKEKEENIVEKINVQLDLVLQYYFENFNLYLATQGYERIWIQQLLIDLKLEEKDFELINRILIKDGYLEKEDFYFKKFIKLSDKGILFWNNGHGGYVKQLIEVKEKEKKQKSLDELLILTSKTQIANIIIAFLFGLGAIIMSVINYNKDVKNDIDSIKKDSVYIEKLETLNKVMSKILFQLEKNDTAKAKPKEK